ncbi:peptidase [Erwinia sp. CPCC 100877]|nr:peptidase [Erwinia sp. CPCC 100877]
MLEQEEAKKNKILLIIVAALLAIIVIIVLFYVRSTHPQKQAEKEAVQIAKEHAQLQSADHFYWLTRKKTYFSVTGKNDQGDEIAVIIPKNGEKVTVLYQKDGVKEGQIRQLMKTDYKESNILKVSLGMFNDQPVWEAVTKNDEGLLSYYLLSFENAEEIKVIKNV